MRRLTLPLLVLATVLAGCGGGSLEDPELAVQGGSMPVVDIDRVKEAEESILTACGDVPPTQEGSDVPVDAALTTLAEVFRTNPEGGYDTGNTDTTRTMRTVVEDNVRRLRECGKTAQAARLAGVL